MIALSPTDPSALRHDLNRRLLLTNNEVQPHQLIKKCEAGRCDFITWKMPAAQWHLLDKCSLPVKLFPTPPAGIYASTPGCVPGEGVGFQLPGCPATGLKGPSCKLWFQIADLWLGNYVNELEAGFVLCSFRTCSCKAHPGPRLFHPIQFLFYFFSTLRKALFKHCKHREQDLPLLDK